MPVSLNLFFILLFLSASAQAQQGMSNYLSVKSLGMGDAYSPIVTGHDSIFVNPAGFAGNSDFEWRVVGLNAGMNGLDSYNNYKNLFNNSSQVASVLNQVYGKPIWGRLDFSTSINISNVIFGAYGAANLGFVAHNPAYPQLSPDYFSEYGAFLGWGREVIEKYLDFGFIFRRSTRYSGSGSVGAGTIAFLDSSAIKDAFQKSGTGYGADVGVKIKFPSQWHPTISGVWKNIGKTSFNLQGTTNLPASLDNEIDAGIGFERDFGLFTLRPAFEGKFLNNNSLQLGQKLHAGVELEFLNLTVRGGYNQGYYTAGASFDFWLLQIDAATYGVELGKYPGQQEDRRYIIQLIADFRFNLSTGEFVNQSRARRSIRQQGLKQRR